MAARHFYNFDRNLNYKNVKDAGSRISNVDNYLGNNEDADNEEKATKQSNISTQKIKEEERSRREYDNYRNTFSDGKPMKKYAQDEIISNLLVVTLYHKILIFSYYIKYY